MKKKDGVVVGVSPEYEDCKEIAMNSNVPLQRVYALVQQEAENMYLQ